MYFVRRKQRVKGRGKKEMKDDITGHQRKGSLPSPLSSSHSPLAFYSTSGKHFRCLLRRLSVPPRTTLRACKASQGIKDVLPRQGLGLGCFRFYQVKWQEENENQPTLSYFSLLPELTGISTWYGGRGVDARLIPDTPQPPYHVDLPVSSGSKEK